MYLRFLKRFNFWNDNKIRNEIRNAWFYPASAEPHKNHNFLLISVKKSVSLGENQK